MATINKNLSVYDKNRVPNGKGFKVGVVVSEWNEEVTGGLLDGAIEALTENGVLREDILVESVPGTFELPLAGQYVIQRKEMDGVICIGSVIQGETRHFDFVCEGAAQGIKDISLKYNKPAIFCVLTDNTMQQALDRSGGKHGNKGVEAGVALLKMIELNNKLSK